MNVPTYPEVKKDIRINEVNKKCTLELSTYIRIKRNKKRYKVLVSESFNVDINTTDIKKGINNLMIYFESFNKRVIDTKYLFTVNKAVIKQLSSINSDAIIKDTNTFSEKDRLKAKALFQRHNINDIIN